MFYVCICGGGFVGVLDYDVVVIVILVIGEVYYVVGYGLDWGFGWCVVVCVFVGFLFFEYRVDVWFVRIGDFGKC